MFRFAAPLAFLLFLPLLAAAWMALRRRRQPALPFSALARLPRSAPTWRVRLRPVAPWLALLGVALAIVAMARPQTVLERITRHKDAIAIETVLDVSGSMDALDFSTSATELRSRLDVVKETFTRFIESRPNDLIGIVSFGGYATSRAPLTLDHAALAHILKGVAIPSQVMDNQGRVVNAEEFNTAIGDALATACARLQNSTNVKSRIIVLLTDGESNTGAVQPDAAAKLAKTMGLRIYTIGVGSTGQAPVRARDMFGRDTIGYMAVSIDEGQLRRIADATGGRYFNVKDPKGLAGALEDINRLEKTAVTSEEFRQYHEHAPAFILAGLALLLLGTALNTALRRRVI